MVCRYIGLEYSGNFGHHLSFLDRKEKVERCEKSFLQNSSAQKAYKIEKNQ